MLNLPHQIMGFFLDGYLFNLKNLLLPNFELSRGKWLVLGGMWHHIEPPQWPLPWPGGKRSSSLECHTHFGSKYVNLNALMETHYPSVNS